MKMIDLNCDLGESFGIYKIGEDEEVLKFISSANIACGFHGGDPLVMSKTVKLAIENSVCIGAHPSYPDLIGFGRRSMKMDNEELKSILIYQIGALKTFVEIEGEKLNHVKPHGALYNDIANNYELAKVVAQAICTVDKDIAFLGLANSQMEKAAEEVGIKFISEVFADRAYNDDGTLVSRKIEGSVIKDTDLCVRRTLKMIKEGLVTSITGNEIEIKAESICVHGDNILALEFIKALREAIEKEGIIIKSL